MPFPRKYSDEVRTSSVQRVLERRQQEPRNRGIIREVAVEFAVGEQSLRQWLARYDDGSYRYEGGGGDEPGLVAEPRRQESVQQQLLTLQRQNETLREENEVLKRALRIMAAESGDRTAGAS